VLQAGREVGLEANADLSKYTSMICHQMQAKEIIYWFLKIPQKRGEVQICGDDSSKSKSSVFTFPY
jgi:hypothetical protein